MRLSSDFRHEAGDEIVYPARAAELEAQGWRRVGWVMGNWDVRLVRVRRGPRTGR